MENPLISSDFARALVLAPTPEIPTAGPWPPYPGGVGDCEGPSWSLDPDDVGGYDHTTATSKTGDGPEAEGGETLAEITESASTLRGLCPDRRPEE